MVAAIFLVVCGIAAGAPAPDPAPAPAPILKELKKLLLFPLKGLKKAPKFIKSVPYFYYGWFSFVRRLILCMKLNISIIIIIIIYSCLSKFQHVEVWFDIKQPSYSWFSPATHDFAELLKILSDYSWFCYFIDVVHHRVIWLLKM